MVPNVHRNHKVYEGRRGWEGVWRWWKREIIYLSLHYHRQNDSCIKMGSNGSHFNVSLIVRDKVTRQCPQSTTFEEKGEPKRIRTEAPLLNTLTPYRQAKRPAFDGLWNINRLQNMPGFIDSANTSTFPYTAPIQDSKLSNIMFCMIKWIGQGLCDLISCVSHLVLIKSETKVTASSLNCTSPLTASCVIKRFPLHC